MATPTLTKSDLAAIRLTETHGALGVDRQGPEQTRGANQAALPESLSSGTSIDMSFGALFRQAFRIQMHDFRSFGHAITEAFNSPRPDLALAKMVKESLAGADRGMVLALAGACDDVAKELRKVAEQDSVGAPKPRR
jgi:hypothetical protein